MSKVKSSSPVRGRGLKPQEIKTKRVPLTRGDVAGYMTMQTRGEYLEHPLRDEMLDILHETVTRMVYSVCNKYGGALRFQMVEDLAQDCWVKIMRYIPRFQRSKSSFSTYCYRICSSVCKDACRVSRRTPETTPITDETETEMGITEPFHSQFFDIKNAILKGMKRFPRYRRVIAALLGDPRKSGYQCSPNIDISYAAKKAGRTCGAVRVFYNRRLGPFLRAKLDRQGSVPNEHKRN